MGVKERIPEGAWQDSKLLASYLQGNVSMAMGLVHPDGAILVFGEGR